MALNIVVPQFLLPYDSVKLGRFINSIDHPHQSYHDPAYARPPEPAILSRDSYIGSNKKINNASFGSALTFLMSAAFSKRAKTQVQVTADRVITYALKNSDELFNEAMGMPSTRSWIERAVDRDYEIYMVVGFHSVTNARITHEVVRGKDIGGQVIVPVSLSLATVGAIAPLGNLTDPSVGGSGIRFDNAQSYFVAPGEQICAFQYRKIRHKWFSSSGLDTSRLSKSPRWSSVERGRDEVDGQDDIIEVEAMSLDNIDGIWDREEAPGGEILLMRAGERYLQG
jgi:hypothetical protein